MSPRDLLIQFLENGSRFAGIQNLKRLGHSGSLKIALAPNHASGMKIIGLQFDSCQNF